MACCKVLTFEVHSSSYDFYTARGVKTHIVNINPFRLMISVPYTCTKLTPEGCSIYTNRPYSCAVYDGRTSPVMKDVCLWNKEKHDD